MTVRKTGLWPKKQKNQTEVPAREYFFLCGGMFGQAVVSGFLTIFLFLFYNRIGIKPWISGLVLGISKVWDGVNDPVVGALIDRKRQGARGKFNTLILGTAFPVGILSALLFFVPRHIDMYAQCVWILALYLGWDMLYTVHDISRWSLTARISPAENERSKIVTYSKTLFEIGLAVPKIFLLLVDEKNLIRLSTLAGYPVTYESVVRLSAAAIGVAGALAMSLTYMTKERISVRNPPQPFLADLKTALHNKTLLLLLLSTLLGSGVLNLGSNVYFFNAVDARLYLFGQEISGTNLYVFFGVFISVPAAFCAPLAYTIGKKTGMKNLIILNFFSNSLVSTIAYFIGFQGGRLTAVMFLMTLASITKTWQRIAYISLVTDSVDYVEWKTGRRMEGETFALSSLTGKLGTGLSTFMAGVTLSALKFNPAPVNGVVTAGALFQKWVWPVFMLGPVAGEILGIVPVLFIDYTGMKREMIQNELRERRALVSENTAADNSL